MRDMQRYRTEAMGGWSGRGGTCAVMITDCPSTWMLVIVGSFRLLVAPLAASLHQAARAQPSANVETKRSERRRMRGGFIDQLKWVESSATGSLSGVSPAPRGWPG